jgi:hypothetical protein
MIEWRSCYELPRTCSWRHGANGEIIVARVDGSVESISSDEFSRKYISRRPAPAEYRDYLRSCEAEIIRLRAEIERQRAHKEALYVCIAQIERAAAGAIYSQEMIHAMALDALKSLEVKP